MAGLAGLHGARPAGAGALARAPLSRTLRSERTGRLGSGLRLRSDRARLQDGGGAAGGRGLQAARDGGVDRRSGRPRAFREGSRDTVTTLRTQRLVTVAPALAFATFDLVQKATAGASLQHARSASTLVLMGVVLLVLVVLVPRIRWTPVAVGAGIAAGGTLGNLVSLLVWSGGVPDPLVVRDIAFNLADVFVFCGHALLLSAAVVYALRNRDRLHLPV